MEDFLNLLQVILTCLSLVASAIGVFFGIYEKIKRMKTQTAEENWAEIKAAATEGIIAAEKTGEDGASKKDIAIAFVNDAMAKLGVDVKPFTDLLSEHIDKWVADANAFQGKE